MNDSLKGYQDNVDRKLRIRMVIFAVIIFILVAISIANVAEGKISAALALGGFLPAVLAGLGLSRMFKIFWHQEKEKVVSQLDTMGTILLILYILIEVGRNWIFGHWLSGAMLSAFGLDILTGLILGRFLGTLIKINKVLSE